MKIQVRKKRSGWYFRLRSSNGRTLCHSEIYKSKQKCLATVDIVKAEAGDAGIEVTL